jgi:SAM-dependent methyltransferase
MDPGCWYPDALRGAMGEEYIVVMTDLQPNLDQAAFWNDEAGRRWVRMNRELDAQLEPLGVAVMDRLGLAPGARVIDVGCGGGATSMMLADRVRSGQVVGVDISAPLIDLARSRAHGVPNLRFEQADAQTFAFENQSFDAVFSRFGVMFFADPVAAFRNLRTALRRDGTLAFICWRDISENPAFTLPVQAALPFLSAPPVDPEPGAPGPFAFADRGRIHDILRGAGYSEIDIAAHDPDLVLAGSADIDLPPHSPGSAAHPGPAGVIESAVELALQVGPLSRALVDAEPRIVAKVRSAVREAFTPYCGPSGVKAPAATWIVVAR